MSDEVEALKAEVAKLRAQNAAYIECINGFAADVRVRSELAALKADKAANDT